MTDTNNFGDTVELSNIASIDDVFLALRSTFMGSKVEVTTDQGSVYKLSIQSLFHEDGSGRSVVVSGYAELIRTPKMKINGMGSKRFEAYLNYKGGNRKGWIKLEQDIPLTQRAAAQRRPEDEVLSL
jgi:hypothetical protein